METHRIDRREGARYEAPMLEDLGQIHEVADRKPAAVRAARPTTHEREEGKALQSVT